MAISVSAHQAGATNCRPSLCPKRFTWLSGTLLHGVLRAGDETIPSVRVLRGNARANGACEERAIPSVTSGGNLWWWSPDPAHPADSLLASSTILARCVSNCLEAN